MIADDPGNEHPVLKSSTPEVENENRTGAAYSSTTFFLKNNNTVSYRVIIRIKILHQARGRCSPLSTKFCIRIEMLSLEIVVYLDT